mgnify:CR=1 FL=1
MAELNNFGAVFTFAIGMEQQIRDYYAAQNLDDEADASSKRIEKLERARREYVVEITLEPIDDLHSDDFVINTDDPSEAGRAAIEATAKRFYTTAAPKINVRQAQRILERCGKQYNG